MPVEIRELVIKATVVQDNASGSAKNDDSASTGNMPANEGIINICIEKMIETEKDKKER